MKTKKFSLLSVIVLSIVLVISGCGNSNNKSSESPAASPSASPSASNGSAPAPASDINALYYVNSTLGDKSFFDSAQAGMDKAVKELGIKAKTVEGGANSADWASGLEAVVASNKYNVVVVGTSQMIDVTKDLASRYPDIKFIFFDDLIEGVPNVYSMLYSQSEGSFLAGAFAALVTTNTELKGANPEKVVGFVGGMDIPIINDFKSGYEQGAAYVDKDVKVVTSYVGDFVNAPKGKELGLAQIDSQKADIVFGVASAAGLGTLEGANEKGVYSIGVDANQNPLYPGSVLTSMMKNVDQSIFRAFELMVKGELAFGSGEVLGIKEGGVGIAKDEMYEKYVPQSIRDKMTEIEDKLGKGEITVKSSL
ncbi:BMP family ABC transporter substrate-binding protein [Cohnella herbarum]|uniref:BMP family ABC transporter substrate-binding protein n=1 Tax=Cohnella herbarum TaxID=2728023 RepID=A0A7Z2ZMU7_9BACL|nr:BMP family ABC transporter substrate-binding protein [Cohnella herbarum]QJD85761.1 BMP family ABC transporter substrate-binding protein [Cohnella herbarum]